MDEDRSLDSTVSPTSSCTSQSISPAKFFTGDEGSGEIDKSVIFHDIESDSIDPDKYAIPRVSTSHHVTESTPLLSSNTSFKSTEDDISTCAAVKSKVKKIKPIFLFLWCLVFAVLFAKGEVNQDTERLLCISNDLEQEIPVKKNSKIVRATLKGPFTEEDNENSSNYLSIGLVTTSPGLFMQSPEVKNLSVHIHTSHAEENSTPISKTMTFVVNQGPLSSNDLSNMVLILKLNSEENYSMAVSLTHTCESITETIQIVLAFVILFAVYVLIIFELVHRSTASMLGALAALSVLSYVNKRPTLEEVLMWIEWETLSLLFGMMILVAVFAKTGFFDYIALKAYKISRGYVWSLLTLLCLFTGVMSAFLDNVTTILLLTPVTIRLCEVLNLDPTNVLIAEVIFSNIGGTATAIGDPPNILMVSHKDIMAAGITFSDFTVHLTPAILVCGIIGYGGLRLLYRRISLENPESPLVAEMKREAEIWRRTAHRVPIVSPEEKTVKLLLLQKTLALETAIRNMERRQSREEAFKQNLKELENKYKITDFPLLIKSGLVIVVVVGLFFLQSFIPCLVFPVGWIAVIGALALILLADIESFEELMEKVEWTTLVFFAGLFVLMRALTELGLFEFISQTTSDAIQYVDHDKRLAVAIVAIIWISALVSSFVDNIPFTTAMIPVTLQLHFKETIGLQLQPLVWALAMGACLGGNGTLIGASANVVCAGLADQYGYPISFMKFTKIGFPMMLLTVFVAMSYLLIYYVACS